MLLLHSKNVGEKGFGVLQAIIVVGVIGVLAASVLGIFQNMNSNLSAVKGQTGRDSISAFLLQTMSEQTLCSLRLKTTAFSQALATAAPGGNGKHMALSYSLSDTTVTPLGSQPQAYPQFNLKVNSIYFANAKLQGTEQVPGPPLNGLNVWKGEVWLSASALSPTGGTPTALADRKIAGTFYIWANGATIFNCGILKTPIQGCVDDLGGKWNPALTTPCIDIPFPCGPVGNGMYFLGYNPDGSPKCVQSAAACPLVGGVGQTVVADGEGGTKCQVIP